MQKIISYTTLCAVLLLMVSCEKFLEKNPDNRASLNTPEQVSQLLATAYPQGNYMTFAESISDNVSDKGNGTQVRANIDPYFFTDVNDDQQDSPEFYWNACYTAIAAANQALEVCNSASDTAAYRSQKGEGLVARAYAHFMLVTFFSKVYDAATADTDPGIPYVTEPEDVVFKQYERKTVSYVYEMIEKDLTEGLPLIDDTKYSVPEYHFTKAAAHAFAARFYLFKKDYAKVVEHANEVFSGRSITSMLRPWNTTYRSMTYSELFAVYAKATEPANLLLVETSSLWGRYYYNVRYGLDAAKQDEILSSNVTGGEWAFLYHLYTAGTNHYLIPKINEYFVRSSINADIGYPYVMVPLFTTEEVLFNRAEAYAEQGNTTSALADLNTYAGTRIVNYNASAHTITTASLTSYYGTGSTKQKVLQTILDFKRAEYVQEGMRWFDMLRHKIAVTHTTTDGQTGTLPASDPRRVFQLPQSVASSGLELNPR